MLARSAPLAVVAALFVSCARSAATVLGAGPPFGSGASSGPVLAQMPSRMLPLATKRIIITGDRSSASPRLAARLAERGARPMIAPTIQFEPCAESGFGPLDEALTRLNDFDVVCLPFADSVRAVHDRSMALLGFNSQMMKNIMSSARIAVIGQDALLVKELLGVPADIMPADQTLAGLASLLESLSLARPGARILVVLPVFVGLAKPPALAAFEQQLEATGASITRVPACIASPTPSASLEIELEMLRTGACDCVVFTSAPEVEGLHNLLSAAGDADAGASGGRAGVSAVEWSALLPKGEDGLPSLSIACHGAEALAAAELWGLSVDAASALGVADELVCSLEEAFASKQAASGSGLIL
mmetsp:Transcript_9450/g.24495  ORF Transcript_9450/g.24495 Transcript_9450/m.24495 type:complete len:360 (-) Transcript_9450:260-1339(-)